MAEAGTNGSIYAAWKSGRLDWEIDRGIIRTAVITYCNVFDTYKKQRDEAGLGYTQAIARTAELMNTSPETVKRAIAEVA
jgi:hypothetical protein